MHCAGRLVRAEHDVGWVEGQVVELRVGCQVGGACSGGHGGDPANGTGDDAGLRAGELEWVNGG